MNWEKKMPISKEDNEKNAVVELAHEILLHSIIDN